MKLVIASAVAATLALSLTPALAKSNHYRHNGYQQQFQGWNSRNVSDPSFGNRAGLANAQRSGRCVVDLGYGRYEYCGW